MSRNGVLKTLAVLTAAYMRDLPEPTIRLYVQALKDLDDVALEQSALTAISTSKWFPTIAELRERTVLGSLPGGRPPLAEEAWQEVIQQVVQVGRYGNPIFSHRLVSETLRTVGGFNEVCNTTMLGPMKNAYLKAYARTIETLMLEDVSLVGTTLKELG